MSARTNSPISDPEPTYSLPEPKAESDPATDQKASFGVSKKYKHVLEYIDQRQTALQSELRDLPDNLSYQEKGMRAEVNLKVIQELENFKREIEVAYELRKQQR